MITTNGKTDLSAIEMASQSVAPEGILFQKMKPATAPVRGTDSDPWNGQNTPSADANPNTKDKSGQIDPGYGKVGVNFGMQMAGVDPVTGLVVNGVYDTATGNPNAPNNTASGLIGLGVKQGLNGALGIAGAPVAAVASEMAQAKPDYGRAAASASGGTLGGLIGMTLGGPVGAFFGQAILGGVVGSSYKDGFIGDKLNTRSGEKIREDIEKTGSYGDSAAFMGELDGRMGKQASPFSEGRRGLGSWISSLFSEGGKGNDNAGPDGTADSGPESASTDDGETMAA